MDINTNQMILSSDLKYNNTTQCNALYVWLVACIRLYATQPKLTGVKVYYTYAPPKKWKTVILQILTIYVPPLNLF